MSRAGDSIKCFENISYWLSDTTNTWCADITSIVAGIYGEDIVKKAIWKIGHKSDISFLGVKYSCEGIYNSFQNHPNYLIFYQGQLQIYFKNGKVVFLEGDDHALGGEFSIGVVKTNSDKYKEKENV